MNPIEILIERNHDFAEQFSPVPLLPKLGTMIISCADPRVDPARVLGVELGEALVIRNIGGRINPPTLQAMAMLGQVAQAEGFNIANGLNLVVFHHTDCGITRLVNQTDMLTGYFGIRPEELPAKAVSDPRAAVAADVAALRANPALPAAWIVSGLVYDVETGLVEVVVPPATLREPAGVA